MTTDVSIPQNTYNAIMFNALQAFRRESWLLEASDIHEATGAPTAEIIEGYFAPFCDRLVKAANIKGDDEGARFGFFKQFTEMAI